MKDTYTSASYLYDGGWRKEDREQLIEEYELTEEEADAVCEELEEIDNRNRPWYAVMRNRDDEDWGYGSYDKSEALMMLKEQDDVDAYIAVVVNDCVEDEIEKEM